MELIIVISSTLQDVYRSTLGTKVYRYDDPLLAILSGSHIARDNILQIATFCINLSFASPFSISRHHRPSIICTTPIISTPMFNINIPTGPHNYIYFHTQNTARLKQHNHVVAISTVRVSVWGSLALARTSATLIQLCQYHSYIAVVYSDQPSIIPCLNLS